MSAMTKCDGCGFNVEREDVRKLADETIPRHCSECVKCTKNPELREAYRRGFNAGLDVLALAVTDILMQKSNLRKR